MTGLFAQRQRRRPIGNRLEEIVLRGFGGGWNTVDEDTNMEPKYQPELLNFRRTPSGAQKLRFGSKFFADVSSAVTGNIVDMDYFNNRIIVVTSTGQMASVTNAGVVNAIWNAAIAAALPGAPAGWGATTAVDFVPWKDKFIVHNGTDKPVIISAAFATSYLQDLATGSNVNTPIGKYGCIAANYHCVGGIAAAPTTVYISSRGTSGTFPGDPAPNDGLSIDVGAFAPSGAPEILGLAGYRQFLIVFFRGQSLIIQLGNYEAAVHVPDFIDEMPQFGLINHRCVASVENDLRFAGFDGMASAKRNLFSGNIDSKFLSAFIEPNWRVTLATATTSALFVVHNAIEHATYLFMNDTAGSVFVYQANDQLKFESWTRFEGARFACGCRSFLGRVFLGNMTTTTSINFPTHIYQMGNDVFSGEEYFADLLGFNQGNWANSTAYVVGNFRRDTVSGDSYVCNVNHMSAAAGTFAADRAANPTFWTLFTGNAIAFTMELPWIDGRTPLRTKQLRFISIDSRGTAAFAVSTYVDFLTSAAAISANFVGNDAATGTKSNDPQLFGYPVKFKTMKSKITGSTRETLTVAGIRFLFSKGRFRR